MSAKKVKCVALYSGGLDSSLAVILMLRQNIEVDALMFLTHFGCDISDKSSCAHDPEAIAGQFGFRVKLMHLGEKFIEIVRHPKFGHGKNMNPCVDCRILMLREAKTYMEMSGAEFIITGEVVGQRPKSQMRNMLKTVEREAGVQGILLRPLSALLLEPTRPELTGLVNRGLLLGLNGRSRKPQMALAKEFGLENYPTPAGGCLLTDPQYSQRLRDLLNHSREVSFNDLNLLKIGRHFRLSDRAKLVVGRNAEENARIVEYRREGDIVFEARDTGSPLALLRGQSDTDSVNLSARLTARYCDLKQEQEVKITIADAEGERSISVPPLCDEELKELRV